MVEGYKRLSFLYVSVLVIMVGFDVVEIVVGFGFGYVDVIFIWFIICFFMNFLSY